MSKEVNLREPHADSISGADRRESELEKRKEIPSLLAEREYF